MSWIMLNLQEESNLIQKELSKFNKSKGTSVIQATTNDSDFEELIKKQREMLLKNR